MHLLQTIVLVWVVVASLSPEVTGFFGCPAKPGTHLSPGAISTDLIHLRRVGVEEFTSLTQCHGSREPKFISARHHIHRLA